MTDYFPLAITDIAHGGEGIGRIDGRVVFVTGAIPGEQVEVEVTDRRKKLLRGRVRRILEPSPDRVEPPCPIVDRCGGCQWQHIAYPRQIELKRQILTQQLHRIGGFSEPPVEPMVASPQPFGYRSTVRMVWLPDGRLGYRMAHSHDLVAAAWCPIAAPSINEILAAPPSPGEPGTEARIWGDPLDGSATLARAGDAAASATITVLGRPFRVSGASFMQANLPQLEAIIRTVIEFLQPAGDQIVIDAYCGIGVIGVSLAPLVRRVIGIESSEPAVEDAAVNGEQVDTFDIWSGSVADVLPELTFETIDAVILDPPRSGCEPETIRAILEAAPATIVYVSCDPATLARDLKTLAAAGYELRTVRPVDLFPQTFHVESVALLRRTAPIKRPGEHLVRLQTIEAGPPDRRADGDPDEPGWADVGSGGRSVRSRGVEQPIPRGRGVPTARSGAAGRPNTPDQARPRPAPPSPAKRPRGTGRPADSPRAGASRPGDRGGGRSAAPGQARPVGPPPPGGVNRPSGPGRTSGPGRPAGQGRTRSAGWGAGPGRSAAGPGDRPAWPGDRPRRPEGGPGQSRRLGGGPSRPERDRRR
ncbi:MAG TPA: TRAM domain-containing protein [Dehalococcoidia bacterium]|nr:TRAM domain-containing protein [Dehalococcoidia bacterium]